VINAKIDIRFKWIQIDPNSLINS